MRLFVFGIAIFLVSSLIGAAQAEENIFEKNPPLLECPILNASKKDKEFIRKTLSVMEPRVQRSIDLIVIHNRPSGIFADRNANAYCILKDNGQIEIHILRSKLRRSTLWHEAAHAYDFGNGCGDNRRWLRAARERYDNDPSPWRPFPSRGVISRLGCKNCHEDIAEWMSHIHLYLSGESNVFEKIKDKKDPRYLQKLNSLLEEGYIGDEAYKQIAEVLAI